MYYPVFGMRSAGLWLSTARPLSALFALFISLSPTKIIPSHSITGYPRVLSLSHCPKVYKHNRVVLLSAVQSEDGNTETNVECTHRARQWWWQDNQLSRVLDQRANIHRNCINNPIIVWFSDCTIYILRELRERRTTKSIVVSSVQTFAQRRGFNKRARNNSTYEDMKKDFY